MVDKGWTVSPQAIEFDKKRNETWKKNKKESGK